jgi:hypothetical protein
MSKKGRRRGVSLREFTHHDGCSEGFVRRGVSEGCLSAFSDASLDQRLAGTAWRKPKENYLALLRQLECSIKSLAMIDLMDAARLCNENPLFVSWFGSPPNN